MSTVFGMSEEDKREIIADFLSETEQHLHALNTYLLKAEDLLKASQSIPDDHINLMFRAAHTIKGSSSMLGFKILSHLTHEMETVLDRVRSKKFPCSLSMVEVLFNAFDSLNAILGKLRHEGNDDMDVTDIVNKMQSVIASDIPVSERTKPEPNKARDAQDMSKYLPAFLEDSDACVERFNEILLGFENGKFTPDLVNELFRLAHTIKGSSGIIRCKGIETVAHHMEDLLVDFRNQSMKPTAEATVLLFKGIDWIKGALETLRNNNYQDMDLSEFLNQFKLKNSPKPTTLSNSNENIPDPLNNISAELENKIRSALSLNNQIFKIKVSIKRNVMASLKAAIVEERLKKAGIILLNLPQQEVQLGDASDIQIVFLYATPNSRQELGASLLMDELEIMSIEAQDYTHLKLQEDLVLPIQGPGETVTGPLGITTMKVDSRKLDNLMNLAGELVITRARFAQLISEFDDTLTTAQIAAKVYDLQETASVLGKLSSDIQSAVMQTRMVAVEGVFTRFKRVVRDISKDLKKEVNLELFGEDTELDKKIIDALPDSLTHMIRNAVDHGIESQQERVLAGKKEVGIIQLKAFHQGNSICIEITDDGRGIDIEKLSRKALEKGLVTPEKLARMDDRLKLNFIFHPGFSTAERVTGLSGRGVGLDVVKKMIEALSGTIDIETQLGQGSRFILRIPLTLAIIQALLVVINQQVYAIPLESVSEIIKIGPEDIYFVEGIPVIKLRGHALSLMAMNEILNSSKEDGKIDHVCKVVVVGSEGNYTAIKVDDLLGEEEIVIKALPECFGNVKGISGASILGDGNIALILDIGAILKNS